MEDGIITYLDEKEIKLLKTLTKEYENFIEPGAVQKQLIKTKEKVFDLLPKKVKTITADTIKKASNMEVIQKVIETAGQGFGIIQENTARMTLDKIKIVSTLKNKDTNELKEFEEICRLRSYNIEKIVVNRRKGIDLPSAFVGGAVTGFFGLYGIPFNLAYTFLMYYRTVQAIALHYGYDVIDDPRELEFASSVTIECLSPHLQSDVQNLGSIITKMMLASNVSSLKVALSKLTYKEMAQKGGAELLYVQVRALANAQAKKALKSAGKEGIEAGIFKNLLEQIGKNMSKEAGKKIIPGIGAVIGALSDTYVIHKVIKGANLIYHKRFLFEKNIRINSLNGNNNINTIVLDYDDNMTEE